jgi:Gpi18-like mannosyltransferase
MRSPLMKTLTFLKTHIIHPVLNLESAIQDKAGKSSHLLFYAGGIILAILLRILLFDFETLDYQNFLSPWYDFIKENGGFPALGKDFSNYSPPYLYLLLLAVYLPLKKLYAIKLITVLFDIAAAVLVFLIVRRKYRSFVIPAAASLVFLFTPTVFINSSMWG